jgi:hypothetical protein
MSLVFSADMGVSLGWDGAAVGGHCQGTGLTPESGFELSQVQRQWNSVVAFNELFPGPGDARGAILAYVPYLVQVDDIDQGCVFGSGCFDADAAFRINQETPPHAAGARRVYAGDEVLVDDCVGLTMTTSWTRSLVGSRTTLRTSSAPIHARCRLCSGNHAS